MSKSLIIFILSSLAYISNAQINNSFFIDSIQHCSMLNELELSSLKENVKVDNLRVVNKQLDAILNNIVQDKKGSIYLKLLFRISSL